MKNAAGSKRGRGRGACKVGKCIGWTNVICVRRVRRMAYLLSPRACENSQTSAEASPVSFVRHYFCHLPRPTYKETYEKFS